MKAVVSIVVLFSTLSCIHADLDEGQKEIESRYAKRGQEDKSEKADAPAEIVTQYRLGTSGFAAQQWAKVWFKNGKSRMEMHVDIGGLASWEIDGLRTRNSGQSSWLAFAINSPTDGQMWIRKDEQVLAWVQNLPDPLDSQRKIQRYSRPDIWT